MIRYFDVRINSYTTHRIAELALDAARYAMTDPQRPDGPDTQVSYMRVQEIKPEQYDREQKWKPY